MEVVTREEAETAILEAAVVADDNTHESDDEDDLQGEAAIIWDILKRINAANELIRDFLGKEKQKKTLDEKISWYTTRRPLHAKNLREYCRSESNAIRLRLNDLLLCLQLNEMAEKRKAKDIIQEKNEDPPLYHSSSRPHHHDEKEEDQRITATPKADDFKKDMSTESYGFWTTYFKQQVRVEWKAFIDAYQLVYGTLETSNRIYIERVLVPRNDDKMITIYGFMAFVVDHDFPFVQNIAGVRTPTTPTKSERHSPTRTDSETEFLPPYSKINDFSLGVQLFEPGKRKKEKIIKSK
ncbi:hypothetical protein BDA99DRAFT_206463 [Phascolomyces articulosus]|uniref:Uncharacterized protein n=1 Tax=Phascolomyces articulosus TaxID=60185 RepID=A0AAD5JS02_9FUNG|nr:hypothetical protein BDA99DRAFT_206463 [Phascolomyces articulosus]